MTKKATSVTPEANEALVKQNEQTDLSAQTPFNFAEAAMSMAGMGTENIGAKEQGIPTLRVLQSNSHELTRGDDKFIEGAKAGDFYAFTPDGPKVFDGEKGVTVYVSMFEKAYIEWIPITDGGGFVARHPTESIAVTERKDVKNEIVETWEYYLIVDPEIEGETPFATLFGCSSSKLKPARDWNSMLKNQKVTYNGKVFVPNAWFYRFTLHTQLTRNKKGQAYFNFRAVKGTQIDSQVIWEMCTDLREAVMGGTIKIDMENVIDVDVPMVEDDRF